MRPESPIPVFRTTIVPRGRLASPALLAALAALLPACRQDMHDQAKHEPLEASTFFSDQRASRTPPPGTVARGQLHDDDLFFTGRVGTALAAELPMRVTLDLLQRGRERYDIFCSPCHDRTGRGRGMVVERGFKPPPSFHDEAMRAKPVGHVFDVITRGFGVMSDYASEITPRDRWAIAAYIRALVRSQRARREDVPPEELARLGVKDG